MQKTALCALACVAAGYFIGCINPAFIIGRIKGYDVRSSGSKNAGASNTVIMAGKLAGVLVALLDIFKAALSWRLCQALFPQFALAGILGGVACILGHMFPVFLHFCGGKGLACIGGVVLAYDPATFLIMLAITCVIGFATNYIAIATVSIAAIWPVYYGVTTGFWAGAAVLAVPFVPILLRHMTNFRRIRAGEELRLNFLWKKDSELERIGYED
ncbi:MAG: glycerol-3-phosphate acyltransferase [Eubacteriales bacterium]|nr:glycerol-3-phosphate acyltransferase [Eubacteriales bacterium]